MRRCTRYAASCFACGVKIRCCRGKPGTKSTEQVLDRAAFVLRFFSAADGDRFLIVNLGTDLYFNPCPEPLLAPPCGKQWQTLFSTDEEKYGGVGAYLPETTNG